MHNERPFCTPITRECTFVQQNNSSHNNNNEKNNSNRKHNEENTQKLELQDLDKIKATTMQERLLRDNLKCLTEIKAVLDEKNESESIADEWKTLARILDRLFIVIFIFAQAVGTVAVFVRIATDVWVD